MFGPLPLLLRSLPHPPAAARRTATSTFPLFSSPPSVSLFPSPISSCPPRLPLTTSKPPPSASPLPTTSTASTPLIPAARLSAEAPVLVLPLVPFDNLHPTVELRPYLLDSFGNASRIDYGTGHETNFATFLHCLAHLSLIWEEDYPAVITRVFVTYLELMCKLQTTASSQPALTASGVSTITTSSPALRLSSSLPVITWPTSL